MVGQRGQEVGIPVGGHEASAGAIQSEATPHSAERPMVRDGQVGHGVGGEGTGDPGLGVAVGAVGQHGLGGPYGRGGVGHVVGQHLRQHPVRRPGPTTTTPASTTDWATLTASAAASGQGRGRASEVTAPGYRSARRPDTGRDCRWRSARPQAGASGRSLGHHGDQRRQHHRIVAGIDLGEQLQVVGHRPRSGPGRSLGPGVHDEQARPRGPATAAAPRCRGGRADGMEKGSPSMRPAEVIGSWATTQPPGRTAPAIRASTTAGSTTWSRRNRQKARSTGFGQPEILAGLGDGQHLAVGGGGLSHLVPGRGVAVHGVDPSRRVRRSRPAPPRRPHHPPRRRRRSTRVRSPDRSRAVASGLR